MDFLINWNAMIKILPTTVSLEDAMPKLVTNNKFNNSMLRKLPAVRAALIHCNKSQSSDSLASAWKELTVNLFI